MIVRATTTKHIKDGGSSMTKNAERSFLNFKRRVTLRQIEVLASLKQTGSITETSKKLKTSPASISRICQRFEGHFDFPIFEKKRKGLLFTDRGSEVIDIIFDLDFSTRTFQNSIFHLFESQ